MRRNTCCSWPSALSPQVPSSVGSRKEEVPLGASREDWREKRAQGETNKEPPTLLGLPSPCAVCMLTVPSLSLASP